jgi:hypothetical protein
MTKTREGGKNWTNAVVIRRRPSRVGRTAILPTGTCYITSRVGEICRRCLLRGRRPCEDGGEIPESKNNTEAAARSGDARRVQEYLEG